MQSKKTNVFVKELYKGIRENEKKLREIYIEKCKIKRELLYIKKALKFN